MALDSTKNFAKVTVSTGYDGSATSIVLTTGHGARFPAASFNVVWWNSTDYNDPTDDPNVEIVRVTAISTDTLTVTRAQESTSASTKNTSAKTYKMILCPTSKVMTDVATDSNQVFTDITTNDASSSKHGFLPKLSGNAATYLDGSGAFSAVSGGTDMFSASNFTIAVPANAEQGSISVSVLGAVTAARGAVNGSTGGTISGTFAWGAFVGPLDSAANDELFNFGKNSSCRMIFGSVVPSNGGANNHLEFGIFNGSGGTNKHHGWDATNSLTLSCSNADGTTQKLTATTGLTLANTVNVFDSIFLTGTNVKFYTNGTLQTTHTANLPTSGASCGYRIYGTNGSNTDNISVRFHGGVVQRAI